MRTGPTAGGAVDNTGYLGNGSNFASASISTGADTTGFTFHNGNAAAESLSGIGTLYVADTFFITWAFNGSRGTTNAGQGAGSRTAYPSGVRRLVFTTLTGTPIFDAGTIRVYYYF